LAVEDVELGNEGVVMTTATPRMVAETLLAA
jgi:hypothetical protein